MSVIVSTLARRSYTVVVTASKEGEEEGEEDLDEEHLIPLYFGAFNLLFFFSFLGSSAIPFWLNFFMDGSERSFSNRTEQ